MVRRAYTRKSFSESEDEVVKDLYGKLPSKDLAEMLGRSIGSVQHRARKLGVSKKLCPFSEKDIELIKDMRHNGASLNDVANFFGKSPSTISEKARRVGLGKWRKSSGRFCGRLIDGFNHGQAVYTHRALIEKALGRKLNKTEIVHHIDGDKDNNDLSNLHLFPSRAEHLNAHKSAGKGLRKLFRKGLITFNRITGLYEVTDSSVSITRYNSK